MKRKALTVVATLVVVGVMAMAVLPVYADPWDGKLGDLKEFSGEVSFKRPGGFFLTTASGEEYKLAMGSPWYLNFLGLELRKGDRITVKGYEPESGLILVTSIRKGKDEYEIAKAEDFGQFRYYGPGPGYGPGSRRGGMMGGWYGRRGDDRRFGPDKWGWRGHGPCW